MLQPRTDNGLGQPVGGGIREAIFTFAIEFADIMGMDRGETGGDGSLQGGEKGQHPPAARAAVSFPNSSEKGTFVLDFVSLIQTFHVGEDLPAAKEKNNLLCLF